MNRVFRYKPNQPIAWHRGSAAGSNQRCLYCGQFIGAGSDIASDKEHLIGKQFVPPNAFDGGKKLNFVFRACKDCNNEKSRLEGHISSVTIYTSPGRAEDANIDRRANEKAAREFHPDKAGMRIAESGEEFDLKFGPFAFGFTSPPQPNASYRNRLALRHVQGLYALICSPDPLASDGLRLLRPDHCWILGYYPRGDWGNPQLLELASRAESWPCHANVSTADGYFKAILKRELPGGPWFWALEWNRSARMCGLIAPPGETPDLLRHLPELDWKTLGMNEQKLTRCREEVPLSVNSDFLFEAAVICEREG